MTEAFREPAPADPALTSNLPEEAARFRVYTESKTLQSLMVLIRRQLDRRSAGDYALALALRSALQRREMKGLETYGKTLDDQAGHDEAFWSRMARDELLDALMYIQKAMSCDARNGGDAMWQRVLGGTIEAVAGLLTCVDYDAIKAMAATATRPDLFPPAELRKEPDDRP